MPTINQLPSATAVLGTDVLPLSQNGLTRSVTVSTLLSGTQPVISVAQGSLLGRTSPGQGGPEAVKLGTGLALLGTSVSANAQDHLGLAQSFTLLPTDEIIINNGAVPKRVVASTIRGLFSPGSGVIIDQSGVISVAAGSVGSGLQGPKGDTGSPGQGFNFRGAWQPATSFAPYDVVVNGGQTYVATTNFVSGTTFQAAQWTLMAAQGASGQSGAQGSAGPQGPAGPIVPATSTSVGAVKPGGGLSVSSDGTLSVGNVSLATLSQGGAATGQVLGWTGTGWGPTSGASAGVATLNGRAGAVTLTLGDITSAVGTGSSARSNLGLASVASSGAFADLSGAPVVPSASTTPPLVNGTAAPGTASAFARADHVHPSDPSRLAVANNLSDLANTSIARANLGLSAAASMNVGMTAGTLAAGNDPRLVGALQSAAIPAASGQLLGGSGTAGSAAAIAIGTGLSLSGGTLTAVGTGTASISPATTTALGGVKPDGTTIVTAADGTLTVTGLSTSSLTDIATLGGPALSDVDIISRGGSDYKVTLSSRVGLFRKTPAGSRTVTVTSGSTTATLTAADHDKTVVVTGTAAGLLAVDGTLTDGFRCHVINHTGSALAFSGITGLQGATTLPNNAACWVSLSNATVEASAPVANAAATPGGSSGQLQFNNNGAFGGVIVGAGLTLSQGTLSVATGGYTLPAATSSTLGGVKPDGATVTTAADGTLSVPGIALSSLTDIATVGGPSLSDADLLNRGGSDYRTTLAARAVLFRKTPAGSRTVAITSGAATVTLTAADNDKTVVITGTVAGTLAADGTITDGFRCQVINHGGGPLALSGITGLGGTTSVAANNSCWVTLSNSTLEALSSTSGYTLPVATAQTLGGVKQGSGLTIAADGTISASGSAGVSTFNTRAGAVTLTLADVTGVTGTGTTAQTSLGLGSGAALSVGTTAGTLAAGNDARLVGALQPSAIPAAAGQLLGGSGTAGSAASISVGAGLMLSGSTLAVSGLGYTLPAASTTTLGGIKQGGGVNIAADGTLSVPAYMTAGVSGVVASLPGGAGATMFRYVFVRPCSFVANLLTPYVPQAQAVTPATSNASFTLAKRSANGTTTSFGTLTITPTGVISAATTATSFAAGDELVITAPSPADGTLADVSFTFTGWWG